MRFILGLLLGLAFAAGGIIGFIAAFDMTNRGITGDDVYAALFLGGILLLIGILIIWAAFITRKRAMNIDPEEISAQTRAMRMGMDFGDDGGGFGD